MAPKASVPLKTAEAKPAASKPSNRGGKKPPKKPAASNKKAELGKVDEQSPAEPQAPPQAAAAIVVTAEEKAELAELQNLFASSTIAAKSSASAPEPMVEAAPAAEGSTHAPPGAPLPSADVTDAAASTSSSPDDSGAYSEANARAIALAAKETRENTEKINAKLREKGLLGATTTTTSAPPLQDDPSASPYTTLDGLLESVRSGAIRPLRGRFVVALHKHG